MLFNSSSFIIFLGVFIVIYFTVSTTLRRFALLLASCIFYAYFSIGLFSLLCLLCLIAYVGSRFIDATQDLAKKKWILNIVILILFLNLGYFKYIGFLEKILNDFLSLTGVYWEETVTTIALPLGISFYTFQIVGYLIDVYKKEVSSEKNYLNFLLYILFFPQLVAGPIERASKLLPQLKNLKNPEYSLCVSGLLLVTWGYFQKIVLADNLEYLVTNVFSNPKVFAGFGHFLGLLAFSLQIFFDFSGYVDIGRGIARILNVNLSSNFNYPYISQSVTEFWTRWHITLSSWFRDYLFFPLAFNNKIKIPIGLLTIIVFCVSGLWHGSNWTFIIWGLLHGLYIAVEQTNSVKSVLLKLPSVVRILLTFTLITFAWIFFRISNISEVLEFLNGLFGSWSLTEYEYRQFSVYSGNILMMKALIFLIFGLVISFAGHLFSGLIPKGHVGRFLTSAVLIYLILFFGEFNENKFIYFQF